jgi:hypothetical protein
MMNKTLRLFWVGSLVLAALLVVALIVGSIRHPGINYGQRVHFEGTPSWVYALVGQVTNQPILLAMVTNQYGTFVAYACDSQHTSEWFGGLLDGTTVDFTNNDGSRFQATLTAHDAQGTLTLPGGAPLAFTLGLATKPAGLYRAKDSIKGVGYLAGWVLLADGRQAGMIENGSQQFMPAPRLDPTHPTISLPGGGTLAPQLITPDSDL